MAMDKWNNNMKPIEGYFLPSALFLSPIGKTFGYGFA